MNNASANKLDGLLEDYSPVDECRLAALKLEIVKSCLDDAFQRMPKTVMDSPLFGLMIALEQIINTGG